MVMAACVPLVQIAYLYWQRKKINGYLTKTCHDIFCLLRSSFCKTVQNKPQLQINGWLYYKLNRKWYEITLCPCEMTLTSDRLESNLNMLRIGVGVSRATILNREMALTPICQCGVIKGNRLITSKHLIPSTRSFPNNTPK